MPPDIEVSADEWERYLEDMQEIQEELYVLWCEDMERSYA